MMTPAALRTTSGYLRVLFGVNAGNAIESYDWMAYALLARMAEMAHSPLREA